MSFIVACFFIVSTNAQVAEKPAPRKTIRNFMNPDSLVLINLKIVPVPIFTSTPETGVRIGGALEYFFNAKEKKSEARGSYVHGQITYSSQKQLDISSSWQIFGRGERYVFRGSAGYVNFNEKLWGIGNNTVAEDAFNKQFYNRVYVESKVYKLLKAHQYVGLSFNFSNTYNVRYEKTLNSADSVIKGVHGSEVFGIGPAFLYDGRDYPFSAHKGAYAEFYYQYYPKISNGGFAFSEWGVDLRKYYPITTKSTFALQFMTKNTIGNVPLREIPRLGSSNIMRGFFTGRYRDLSYTAAQAEIRVPVWRFISGAVFGSAGMVNESISKYQLNELRYAGGAGLRFLVNKKNRMILRVDYARNSLAGSAFYIRLQEAF